jgi:hypothetical protein
MPGVNVMPSPTPARAEDALTVQFEESLDAAAARRARELLASAHAQSPVVLDFTRVRHLDWHALATLTRALADHPPGRATLRGLCESHLKVLRYLDVRLGPLHGAPEPVAHGGDALVPRPPRALGGRAVQA